MLKEVIKLIRPEKKMQKDVFDWYEQGIWMAEIIKCKANKKQIFVKAYFDDDTEKYYIEYYNK